ncbi:MAG: acetolactate synthase large subunit, partial [Lachnospiraceae bacterium]|nr:acetolactate synthase large subunit [Lachnospiraceae bacterium]
VVPGDHEKYLGMTGIHGTKAANNAVMQCDLCIACGVRFSDRAMREMKTFAPNADVIHIDIDPAEINKNVNVTLPLTGDVKHVLRALLPFVTEKKHPTWVRTVCDVASRDNSAAAGDAFSAELIVQTVYDLTKDRDTIITAEVGAHQMTAAGTYKFRSPRTLLTSGGLGTMGFGLGAAIGAKLSRPAAEVINLAGDGCFRMNMAELATASRYGIPVIEIIFNNHCLGLVRELQDEYYDGRHSCTDIEDNVDFVKVAEGLGCDAVRAENKKELEKAIKKALASKKPFVIDCITCR